MPVKQNWKLTVLSLPSYNGHATRPQRWYPKTVTGPASLQWSMTEALVLNLCQKKQMAQLNQLLQQAYTRLSMVYIHFGPAQQSPLSLHYFEIRVTRYYRHVCIRLLAYVMLNTIALSVRKCALIRTYLISTKTAHQSWHIKTPQNATSYQRFGHHIHCRHTKHQRRHAVKKTLDVKIALVVTRRPVAGRKAERRQLRRNLSRAAQVHCTAPDG